MLCVGFTTHLVLLDVAEHTVGRLVEVLDDEVARSSAGGHPVDVPEADGQVRDHGVKVHRKVGRFGKGGDCDWPRARVPVSLCTLTESAENDRKDRRVSAQ